MSESPCLTGAAGFCTVATWAQHAVQRSAHRRDESASACCSKYIDCPVQSMVVTRTSTCRALKTIHFSEVPDAKFSISQEAGAPHLIADHVMNVDWHAIRPDNWLRPVAAARPLHALPQPTHADSCSHVSHRSVTDPTAARVSTSIRSALPYVNTSLGVRSGQEDKHKLCHQGQPWFRSGPPNSTRC